VLAAEDRGGSRIARLVRRRSAVTQALGASDVAPTTAVGDVAQLLHIHVQQLTGVRVFVAAYRLTGDPVYVCQPVDPTPAQHLVGSGWGNFDPIGDRDRAQALLPGPGARCGARSVPG